MHGRAGSAAFLIPHRTSNYYLPYLATRCPHFPIAFSLCSPSWMGAAPHRPRCRHHHRHRLRRRPSQSGSAALTVRSSTAGTTRSSSTSRSITLTSASSTASSVGPALSMGSGSTTIRPPAWEPPRSLGSRRPPSSMELHPHCRCPPPCSVGHRSSLTQVQPLPDPQSRHWPLPVQPGTCNSPR
jgi:hypothetical protein